MGAKYNNNYKSIQLQTEIFWSKFHRFKNGHIIIY